jgi:NitT/TauT family transport system substrate-binding protein
MLLLAGSTVVGLATACSSPAPSVNSGLAVPGQTAPAQRESVKKVSFGFGTKTIDPLATTIVIGQELGYYREEGLEVEFKAVGSVAAMTEAVRSGNLTMSVGSPTFLLTSAAKGDAAPTRLFHEYAYPFKWDWAVPPDSPVRDLADLKGKKLGVANFGTIEQLIGKSMLRQVSIDPENDVSWTAVGEGTTGHIALSRADIDAMIYYDTGFGAWDAAGLAYRLLDRPKEVPQVGGFFLQATPSTLQNERAMAVGLGRGTAKGTVFALENIDAAAKTFLKMFPEVATASRTTEENVRALAAVLARRKPLWKSPDPSITKLGFIREQELRDEVKFLDLASAIPDVTPFFTNELNDEINAFDPEPIRRQARELA